MPKNDRGDITLTITNRDQPYSIALSLLEAMHQQGTLPAKAYERLKKLTAIDTKRDRLPTLKKMGIHCPACDSDRVRRDKPGRGRCSDCNKTWKLEV